MQIRIPIVAHFETPFHIGGGVTAESAMLKPLLKDALGRPYVPGSALKGVLRHEAERITRALGNPAIICRAPHAETMCPQAPRFNQFCPVCRTFGSPGLPSLFQFGDLTAKEDTQAVTATALRHGVGVSRYRGAAAEALLYVTETAASAPFVPFSGEIQGDISESERGPLALLLAALAGLQMLGAGRSRGLGWVKIEVTQPPLSPQQVKEEVQRWLTPGV